MFRVVYWLMPKTSLPAWLPYVAPYALFLALNAVEGRFPDQYPLLYTLKIALVAALLLAFRRHFPEARPGGSGLAAAALLGVVLTFVWVLLDQRTPHFAFLGARVGYNPFREIPGDMTRLAFLAVRFLGLVVVAPFMEELFLRSFLLRFVTNLDDFRSVPQGTFSLAALAINILVMALSHPEWLVAAIFSAALCSLLAGTKNLFACVLAHATTNLLLGIYVLHTHDWHYW